MLPVDLITNLFDLAGDNNDEVCEERFSVERGFSWEERKKMKKREFMWGFYTRCLYMFRASFGRHCKTKLQIIL